MKYIDADKLIKSVNNYQEGAKAALNPTDGVADYYKGKIDACKDIQEFIASLQQEQQEEPDKDLEDAAKEYCKTIFHKPFSENPQEEHIVYEPDKYAGFIAGAKWQAEQDDRDVVFWKGMQHAIAGMKKDAVEGVIIDSGFDDGTAFVTMNIPDRRYDRGDKVKLIIIKDDGKSD